MSCGACRAWRMVGDEVGPLRSVVVDPKKAYQGWKRARGHAADLIEFQPSWTTKALSTGASIGSVKGQEPVFLLYAMRTCVLSTPKM